MTDAPYSKAIEEGAKATSNAVDLIRDGGRAISRPVANIYNLLIGDKIEAARERNLDEVTRETRKILKERDVSEMAQVAEAIAIPLLEAAQGEPRERLQKLWAMLLANAMDPSRRDDVRVEFIDVLRQFHPLDALVLKTLSPRRNTYSSPATLADELKHRVPSVVVSCQHLHRLGCLDGNSHTPTPPSTYIVSNFGVELLLAVSE